MIVPLLVFLSLFFLVFLTRINVNNPSIARFEFFLIVGLFVCSVFVGFILRSDLGIVIKILSLILGWEYLRLFLLVKSRVG